MVSPHDANRLQGLHRHLVALTANTPRFGARLGFHDEILFLEALHGVEHRALAQSEETGGSAFGLVESLPGVLEPEDAGIHNQVSVLEAQVAPHKVPDQDESMSLEIEVLGLSGFSSTPHMTYLQIGVDCAVLEKVLDVLLGKAQGRSDAHTDKDTIAHEAIDRRRANLEVIGEL